VTHWRAAWYWYLAGPALILAYQGLALVISLGWVAGFASPLQLPAPAVWLELALVGGWWEEPGWTGYAWPRLQDQYSQRRHGIWIAFLIMAAGRAIWHLPLYLSGHLYWFDLFLFSFAFQAIIAWLYNRSGGSVPVVMLFHFASNVIGATFAPLFSGADQTLYYALFMGLACLAALAVARFIPPPATDAQAF
jgi:hypothetical protein